MSILHNPSPRSMVTGYDEIYQGDERVERLRRGEIVAEYGAGFIAKPFHRLVGIFYAAVGHSVVNQGGNFLGGQHLLPGQLHHTAMLLSRVGLKDMEQRQCDFPLTQVIACGLPYAALGEVVKDIILDLEAKPQQAGELPQGLKPARVLLAGGCRAHLRAAYEERSGLAVYYLEIGLLVEMVVAGIVNLVKLAYREQAAERGYRLHDAYVAGLRGENQRVGEEEVADKHSQMIVPQAVYGLGVAPHTGVVDDIVMDERGVVEQLHGHGPLYYIVVDLPQEPGAENHHHRADLLPFLFEICRHHLVHQGVGGCQSSRYEVIQPL